MDQMFSFLPTFPKVFAGDLSLILLFVGLSLLAGFIFGRYKLVNILINIYIAVAIIGILPAEWLDFSLYGRAFTFLGLLVFLTMIDQWLFDIHFTSMGTDIFWRFFVTSFLVTGTTISTFFSFLPRSLALQWISPSLYGYVAGEWALLFWLIVPLITLFVINRRLR